MRVAPTASRFFIVDRNDKSKMTHEDYMDFAERYEDFIAEFERMEGNILRVTRWPVNYTDRRFE